VLFVASFGTGLSGLGEFKKAGSDHKKEVTVSKIPYKLLTRYHEN